MPIRSRFRLNDPAEGADVLEQWKSDYQARTRAEIVDEIGNALLTALRKIGFDPSTGKTAPVTTKVLGNVTITHVKQPAKKAKRKRKPQQDLRPGSKVTDVFEMIRDRPGNRGVDVLNLLAAAQRDVNERTFRTALRRLRVGGFVEQRFGKWFPTKEHEKQTAQ